MNKLRIALAFAFIFLLGAAAGAVGGISYTWHRLLSPPSPEGIAEHLGGKLQSQLDLTAEQTARIQPMLLRASNEGLAIRRDTLQRLRKNLDDLDRQISAELTPEQRKKYEPIKPGADLIQTLDQADAATRKNSPK